MTNTLLSQPPSDGISSLEYHKSKPNLLAVASWDKNVRVYDTLLNNVIFNVKTKAPLLCISFLLDNQVVAAGLEKNLNNYNLETLTIGCIGNHDAPISSLATSQDVIISGSWDKSIRIWDTKSNVMIRNLSQKDKVFTLDRTGNYLVAGLAGREIVIYDLRNLSDCLDRKESTLKHMLRKVKCIPSGIGYASCSIEGRVAVDYFDEFPDLMKNKFSFKCHRIKDEDEEVVYPVNDIAYHPKYQQTFATGGGDGIVNIWDGSQKKRLRQSQSYGTSISALSFNSDGTQIAIAASYTFEDGEKDHPPDSIFIRQVVDQDVKPKLKTR